MLEVFVIHSILYEKMNTDVLFHQADRDISAMTMTALLKSCNAMANRVHPLINCNMGLVHLHQLS